ncbi:hypothetical protein CY34DRAFT_814601, partial [Suillus luteus UH-Slu-Lm8-n1]
RSSPPVRLFSPGAFPKLFVHASCIVFRLHREYRDNMLYLAYTMNYIVHPILFLAHFECTRCNGNLNDNG